MLRICEITGLTPADIVEVMGFCMGFIIASVFAGNVMTWFFKESLKLLMDLIFFVSGHVRQYLVKKRRK